MYLSISFLKIPTYSWSFVFNILNVLHSLIGPVSSLSRAPVFLFLVHSRHVNNLQLGHFRYFSAMANWIQFHDFQVSELDIWVLSDHGTISTISQSLVTIIFTCMWTVLKCKKFIEKKIETTFQIKSKLLSSVCVLLLLFLSIIIKTKIKYDYSFWHKHIQKKNIQLFMQSTRRDTRHHVSMKGLWLMMYATL